MKEKLTLEHLTSYLPYNVKVIIPNTSMRCTLSGINFKDKTIEVDYPRKKRQCCGEIISFFDGKDRRHNSYIDNCKLLLHPLSKLTEEIEHNGEKFIPLNKLSNHAYDVIIDNNFVLEDIERLLYRDIKKLFEWNFDVFDLHSKNLCIYYDELKK